MRVAAVSVVLGLLLSLGSLSALAQEEHRHHPHGAPAPASPVEATPPAGSIEMGGRASRPETPDEAALKSRFNVEYMLRANQRRRVFHQFLPTLGAQGMLDVLERRNRFCHSEAHELGRVVYEHFKDLGQSLMECGERCTSACTHGVLHEAFGTMTIEALRARLSSICTEGATGDTRQRGTCAHGIGHALMHVLKNDVDKAVESCRDFNHSAMEYFCATGAYMELFDHADEWTTKSTSLHYPCDVYTLYPAACYRYQAGRMLRELGRDPGKLAEACRSLPPAQQSGCFHGFGFALYRDVAKTPELMARLCPDAPGPNQTLCIEGVAETLGGFDAALALTACGHLRGPAAGICNAAARDGLYRLTNPSQAFYVSGRPAPAEPR
jgi:hypothetical protein